MVALIIILVIIAAIVLYVVSTYNNLVSLRNKVNDQWSQIDVELKRRFDLIPNLVETVKGYAKHEKETLENVIKARNSYLTAGTKEQALNADKELNGALSRLLVTVEQYPDLKANQSFLDLQAQLKDTGLTVTAATGTGLGTQTVDYYTLTRTQGTGTTLTVKETSSSGTTATGQWSTPPTATATS